MHFLLTRDTLVCQELRDAWIRFLDRWSWCWFVTLTFRGDYVHPETAYKRFRVFISQINRMLYGIRWYKHGQGVRWCLALEWQKRGVLHYHALIGGVGVEDLRRLSWMDRWHELAGFARIEPIRSSEAVRRYVSKYVVKGGELDLGGPLLSEPLPLLGSGQVVGTPEPDGAYRIGTQGPARVGGFHLSGCPS